MIINLLLFLKIYGSCKNIIDNIIEKKEPEIERSKPYTQDKGYIRKLIENYEVWSREYQKCSRFVHWYSPIMTIFPFLGILGTVWALLSSGIDFGEAQAIKANFLLALTSTFWGLIGAIASKFGEGFFSHDFERLKTYFEMFTKDMLAIQEQENKAERNL